MGRLAFLFPPAPTPSELHRLPLRERRQSTMTRCGRTVEMEGSRPSTHSARPSSSRGRERARHANDNFLKGRKRGCEFTSIAFADRHRHRHHGRRAILPLGIPHGAFVRKLSRKSRSKRLADGNVSATCPSLAGNSSEAISAATAAATRAARLVPMASQRPRRGRRRRLVGGREGEPQSPTTVAADHRRFRC